MLVSISGSGANDKAVVFQNVTAGTITLLSSYTLVDEAEGASVTIATTSDVWINYFDSTGAIRINGAVVSSLVWHIMTYHGKLSYKQSTINPDIDYASWLAWAVHVDNGGYTLYDIGIVEGGGPPCADVLMKIAQLTESAFWVGNDGKIKFQIVRTPGAWRTYTDEILKVDWNVSMEDRVNAISCAWGYTPDSDRWLSDISGIAYDDAQVGPSDVPYAYTSEYEQDRSVFHNNGTSAGIYIAAKLARCAAPPRPFTIQTQTLGFAEDVRNDIALQNLYADPYDDIGIQINEIVYNVDSWEVTISGWFIWSF
jgi:hypothetical protein